MVKRQSAMLVKLFDVQNGKVIPSEHCYSIKSLKGIMDKYPDTYMQVYLFIFYMTCPDPDMNPFFNMPEHEKEDLIIEEVGLEESTEDAANRYNYRRRLEEKLGDKRELAIWNNLVLRDAGFI